MAFLSALIHILLTITHRNLAQSTPCSPAGQQADPDACFRAVGQYAQDPEHFWFGSEYSQSCPNGPDRSLECALPTGMTTPQSIASRLFSHVVFNASSIDRYLHVTYTSQPGSYNGCGNTFKSPIKETFQLDPLSMMSHKSWTVRDMPAIQWDQTPGHLAENYMYTLLIINVVYGHVNALYANINGGNINNFKSAVNSYMGPRNAAKRPDVYAFLLFAQGDKLMSFAARWTQPYREQFNVSDFMIEHGLSSPVAMNWLLVSGDEYAAEMNKAIVNNCPAYVTDAIRQKNRPFIPQDSDFSVFVDVTFSPPAMVFNVCCEYFSYPKKITKANPMGNELFKPGDVRTGYPPTVELTMAKLNFNRDVDFAGKQYTLVMLDPDVPFPTAGTNERPLLHWLVVNISNGNVINGDELRSYRGPGPPDSLPHYYYFLLYEQQFPLQAHSPDLFVGESCSGVSGRCQFNISGFALVNDLKLVGASWIVSQNDEFVRYSHVIGRRRPEAEVCQNIPGYADPCPLISSSVGKRSMGNLFVIFVVLFGVLMSK